jgi:chemotaxis protein methyltransferase CheR
VDDPSRPDGPLLAATRDALETTYGLALEGLNADQIGAAVFGAAAAGMADARDPAFVARVLDRLPIDESWLFRDDALWEWLRDSAGPGLLDRARESARKVRILSLGCSSGQEPFSAAMLFQDLLEKVGLPPSAASAFVSVVGVDSSPSRIELARSGLLPAWSVQRCRPDWLRGRVTAEPGPAGRHRVAGSVQSMCRFERGNLVDVAARGNAALGGYDLVFCRNVLIYFRAESGQRLVRDLARGLDPGAHLVLSAPEAHLLPQEELETVGFLGAGRAAPRASAPPRKHHPRPASRPRTSATPRPWSAQLAGGGEEAVPAGRPAGVPSAADAPVAVHVEEALRHAEAGRRDEALRSTRAALLHDPSHLYSQLLLGQNLMPVDVDRARNVLRLLLESVSRLSPEAGVPGADGLSMGQLAAAARILLARRGEA